MDKKTTFFQPTLLNRDLTPLNVEAFIDNNTSTWDQNMFNDMYVADDKKLIEHIHLEKNPIKDSLIWNDDESGVFSVKSAYWLAKEIENQS